MLLPDTTVLVSFCLEAPISLPGMLDLVPSKKETCHKLATHLLSSRLIKDVE